MPRFLNPSTGEVANYEGNAALAAARAGFQPVDGGSVDVYTPSGQRTAFDVRDIGRVEDSLPVVGADPGEIERQRYTELEGQRLQEEHGGAGGQVGAFIEGGVDALTLGGYGAASEALGGDYEERARANPKAHIGGEVTGLLGAVLIPGAGEAAVGRAGLAGKALAATPAGLVSGKAARLAETIGGLKGAAAGQALEGALYATGQTLSQAYIHDESLTASALFDEVGKNALFGAGIGASGAVIAKALAKTGGKLAEASRGVDTALIDLTSEEARTAFKTASRGMAEVETQTANTLAKLEKRAGKAVAPSADEATLPKGVLTADDLPSAAEQAVADTRFDDIGLAGDEAAAERVQRMAAMNSPAAAPLQRRKILKSVGDQVMDTGMELNALTPAEVRLLKKSYASMDEAVTFAQEAGSKAAVAGAHRAAAKYEEVVAGLAQKTGIDVTAQLEKSRSVLDEVVGVLPREEQAVARVADEVEATTVAAPKAAEPVQAPAGAAGPVDQYATAAANIRESYKLAKSHLGLADNHFITADAIRTLLTKEPAEMLAGLNRMDDYFGAMRKGIELTGDARALVRYDKALDDFAESISGLSGGAKLTDLDHSVIATALGSEALAKGAFNTKAAESLHELAALSKMTTQKLPKGVTKKSVLGGLLTKTTQRTAARAVDRAVGGGVKGALVGGMIGFPVIGALVSLTAGSGGRIAGSVGKVAARAMKASAKAVRPASLTAAWLVRESRWSYDPKDNKPTAKTLREAFRQRSEELAKIAANPDAAQLKIHNELAPLRKHAPGVADELEMLSISVPQYLYDKMPKDPGTVMRWGKSDWAPHDYEVLRWGEHMRGAVAPVETFETMMETGYITPQAAEAVRTLHPALFDKMQLEVFQRADELKDKLDHGGQVRISLFFDVPVTSTMRPEFRAFMKERFALKAQTQGPTGPKNLGTSSGSVDAVEPYTGAQQLLKQ